MASKIATIGLFAVFVACLGMLLYMAITFLKDAAEDSVGTAVESTPLQAQEFTQVVVCIGGWEFPSRNPKTHYILGYLGMNLDLFDGFHRHDEKMFSRFQRQNERYLESQETFNKQLTRLIGVITNLQSEKLEIVPSFLTRRHCFIVSSNRSKTEAMDTYAARSGHQRFSFMVPDGMQEVSVSLYSPNKIDELSDQHFNHILVKDGKVTELLVELEAKALRHEYLKENGKNCAEAPGNGKTVRLPVNHLEESCNMDCVYEAGEAAFNCTALPAYLKGRRVTLACHSVMLEPLRYGRDDHQHYREVFEACKERKACAAKRSCEEWELELKQTKLPKVKKVVPTKDGKDEHPRLEVELKISFESKMTIVRQFKLHSWSSIVGNVGGLVGIWLGLSVFGVCEMLFSAAQKRKQKQTMTDLN